MKFSDRTKVLKKKIVKPDQNILVIIFTFSSRSTTIVVSPSRESDSFKFCIFSKIFFHDPINSLPLPGNPNSDLIWLLAMVRAAAVVNPTITGIDTKSTRKPGKSSNVRPRGIEQYFVSLYPS